MNRDAIDFENGKISRLFRRLFFPTLIGSLSISAMTAIDGIFIGQAIGSDGVAAVNITAPLWMIFAGLSLMLGLGCSVVTAIHLSQQKLKVARLNVSQALAFATTVTTLICALILSFPEATANILGSSPHLEPMVCAYLMGIMPGFIFETWSMIGLFIIRLDGSPHVAMWCNAISSLLNIVLDWLMIVVLDWGLIGAAIASTISMIIGGFIAMGYLLFFAHQLKPIPIKMSKKSLLLSLRNIGYHCRIGSSSLLGESTLAILIFVGNLVFMRYLGDDGVGAFGVACYYTPFLFMVGNSIAQSAQPIISYNYGIKRFDRVRQTLDLLIITAFICGLIVTSAFTFFPHELVGLFLSPETRAAQLAIDGFPLFSFGFIAFILNIAVVGYFQSIKRVKPATCFAILRGCLFLIPSFYILPLWWGTAGIWLAVSAAEILTLLVIIAYVLSKRKIAQKRSSLKA